MVDTFRTTFTPVLILNEALVSVLNFGPQVVEYRRKGLNVGSNELVSAILYLLVIILHFIGSQT